MKLIAIGDSITYGQGVRADQAWPAVLARLTGHDVRNEGVCGDTTRLGLERFPMAVQIHKPDVVVLQFGHNDANHWDSDNGLPRVSVGAYAENLWEMRDRAYASGASRVLAIQPHPRPISDAYTGSHAYNGRLSKWWDTFASNFPRYEGGYPLVGHPLVSVLDDGKGIHPDPAMHERYARLVAEALK